MNDLPCCDDCGIITIHLHPHRYARLCVGCLAATKCREQRAAGVEPCCKYHADMAHA